VPCLIDGIIDDPLHQDASGTLVDVGYGRQVEYDP
jgi:hypothetical protein